MDQDSRDRALGITDVRAIYCGILQYFVINRCVHVFFKQDLIFLYFSQPDLFLNDIQYRILELLALSRTNGLFQTDLATKLNVDAKMCFFHLKKLDVHGLLYV